jgi:predicted metal-dependent peptidase
MTLKETEFNISNDEFFQLSRLVEAHHTVFNELWKLGKPVFTNSIPTACVKFDVKTGDTVDFCFNPKFYQSISNEEKAFIICHECLHILLKHGIRGDFNNPEISNVAMDIAANNILINNFGFNRQNLPVMKKGCWVDTVFKKEKNVPTNESFEFYYNKIVEQCKKEGRIDYQSIDDHSATDNKDIDKLLDRIKNNVSEDERKKISKELEKHIDLNVKKKTETFPILIQILCFLFLSLLKKNQQNLLNTNLGTRIARLNLRLKWPHEHGNDLGMPFVKSFDVMLNFVRHKL